MKLQTLKKLLQTLTVTQKVTIGVVLFVVVIGVGGGSLIRRSQQQANYGYGNQQKAVLFTQDQAAGPLQQAYQARAQAALASDQPILTISGLESNGDADLAQNTAIAQDVMQQAARDKDSGQALRAQVFQVYMLPAADSTGDASRCRSGANVRCYTVEIYFFANNATGKSVVAIEGGAATVLKSSIVGYTQPELPKELTDITKELIKGSRELKSTLGKTIDISKLTMVNGKTALQATRCERSEHLCVAPTLAEDDEAYWIIVDMTDVRIVGVSWSYWKDTVPDVPPSEQAVIDTAITRKYCGVSNTYDRNGWNLSYNLTGSDGIEVKDVRYKGTALLASAKNTDWHVSYSRQEGFGYSDAVGCPVFSTAAVVPATEPKFTDIKDSEGKKLGFELVQEFKSKLWPQPCNYYYQQRFQFFDDGSFRPVVVNLGRGCGDDGTYRPVTRIQPATSYTAIERWDNDRWQVMSQEVWEKDSAETPLSENVDDFRYRLISDNGTQALGLSLGRGQFDDGGRGDNAWVYTTRYHSDRDEGSSDLATLGSCCSLDSKQGPDVFTDGESLKGVPLLLWYVSEQKNNATEGQEYCWAKANVVDGVYKTTTYPCASGPKLSLTKR